LKETEKEMRPKATPLKSPQSRVVEYKFEEGDTFAKVVPSPNKALEKLKVMPKSPMIELSDETLRIPVSTTHAAAMNCLNV
jgi:hypothetical protein